MTQILIEVFTNNKDDFLHWEKLKMYLLHCFVKTQGLDENI